MLIPAASSQSFVSLFRSNFKAQKFSLKFIKIQKITAYINLIFIRGFKFVLVMGIKLCLEPEISLMYKPCDENALRIGEVIGIFLYQSTVYKK